MFGEEYKLWSSSLSSFHYMLVASHVRPSPKTDWQPLCYEHGQYWLAMGWVAGVKFLISFLYSMHPVVCHTREIYRVVIVQPYRLLSTWCRAESFLSASGAALSQEIPTVKWMSNQLALWTPGIMGQSTQQWNGKTTQTINILICNGYKSFK
jgi:hypothetical protein